MCVCVYLRVHAVCGREKEIMMKRGRESKRDCERKIRKRKEGVLLCMILCVHVSVTLSMCVCEYNGT